MRKLWFRTSLIMVIVVLLIGLLPVLLSYPQIPNSGPKHQGQRQIEQEITEIIGERPTEEEIQAFREAVEYRFFWDFVERMVLSAIIGAAIGILLSWSLAGPLRKLEEGAKEISAGNLSIRVSEKGAEEFKSLATAFNQMAEALEKQEDLRRNLLADVTHELRHPAHLLQGNIRAIMDEVYPLSKEEISRLYDQTELLTTLVNDLHMIAQAEAGQLNLNLVNANLAELVQSTVDTYRPLAEADGIDLRVSSNKKVDQVFDRDRIRQVVQNLLSNAIAHSSEGDVVEIALEQGDGSIRLMVTDQGEGMEADQLELVFQRFFRADSSRNRENPGSGLGLSISKAIVEAHGGEISAHSEGSGKGMTITINLPMYSTSA